MDHSRFEVDHTAELFEAVAVAECKAGRVELSQKGLGWGLGLVVIRVEVTAEPR